MKQHGANTPDFSFHVVLCNASLSIHRAGFALVTEVALLNLHDFKKAAGPRLPPAFGLLRVHSKSACVHICGGIVSCER